jgi:ribonuclease G
VSVRTEIDEVLVETRGDAFRAAALAQGELIEIVVEAKQQSGALGGIYVGRVVREAPQLRAVFVDIGLERSAMLDTDRPVAEGSVLTVQIIEAPNGDKAARVSRRVALDGRAVVLLPGGKGLSFSRRLGSEKSRKALETAVAGERRSGEGLIVRAAAANMKAADVVAEIASLRAKWQALAAAEKNATPPFCLLDTSDGLIRLLRRFAGQSWPRFVIDDANITRRLPTVAARFFDGPTPAAEVEPLEGKLFDRHGIADVLASTEERVLDLPSGGRISIEPTAALTAIDVDTGSATQRRDAVPQTNREAAVEIARQLRLRDIGGLIVVDFGRIMNRAERTKLEAELARVIAYDRVPVQLVGWTKAGMFEMIRPRARAAGSVE